VNWELGAQLAFDPPVQFDQEEEGQEEEERGLWASMVLLVVILASPCSTAVPSTSKKQFWKCSSWHSWKLL